MGSNAALDLGYPAELNKETGSKSFFKINRRKKSGICYAGRHAYAF